MAIWTTFAIQHLEVDATDVPEGRGHPGGRGAEWRVQREQHHLLAETRGARFTVVTTAEKVENEQAVRCCISSASRNI